MTKSGIGTQNMSSNNNTASTPTPSSQTPTPSSSSALIANAEIPIWVADKKKWVTGISKKTTINDLIFAILKQCQIFPQKNNNIQSNETEPLVSQYVLVEYNFEPNSESEHQVILASQRILNGDSKVYKFLQKWSFSGQQVPLNQQNNLMLKILQRQAYETTANVNSENNAHHNESTSTPSSFNNGAELQSRIVVNNPSLASKLLKKFGVSSSSNTPSSQVTKSSSTILNNSTSNDKKDSSSSNQNSHSYRYVDVKLPSLPISQSQFPLNNNSSNTYNTSQNKSFNLSPVSSNSTGSLNNNSKNSKNFDPNVQKSFITTSIMEKDNKLKQQIKRFQLIDEMIKETEKKSKSTSTTSGLFEPSTSPTNRDGLDSNGFSTNPTYNYSPGNKNKNNSVDITSLCPPQQSNDNNPPKSLNVIDLNDVYCHFPEMSTHHLKEVEDFTIMCSQLFQLEEAIKNQKQILSSLEVDLQRELQPNQANFLIENSGTNSQFDPLSDTPETEELRKEVNYSREKTRLQCKQLHDLDMRMKQNEQNLMSREQELQQLLEELYIQEIYADNVLETAITNTTPNRPTTPSSNHNVLSTFKTSSNSPNNLRGGDDVISNPHENSTGVQNDTVNSFENNCNENNNCSTVDREKMVELIINERNSFNNSNIDFIQLQQQKRIAMENALENHTKRQMRMFNESNLEDNVDLIKASNPNSIKIVNQSIYGPSTNQSSLQTQQKSHSYSNLSNQNNSNHSSNSTHNLNQIINSPPQQQSMTQMCNIQNKTLNHSLNSNKSIVFNNNNSNNTKSNNHSMTTSMKNLKIQNNGNNGHLMGPQNNNGNIVNGDHSGGDNDSGISSMSSETAAAITSALNSNLNIVNNNNNNSFNYVQKPIIMSQINRQNNNNIMFNPSTNSINNNIGSKNFNSTQSQQFLHRQIYQNPNINSNSNNISINQNHNASTSNVSKAVLETLV